MIRERAVSERYARALLELVPDDGQLDAVVQLLEDAAQAIAGNDELTAVLMNRSIEPSARRAVLDKVLERLEVIDVVKRFVSVLDANGRLALLKNIPDVFRELVDEKLSRGRAHITTAIPLDDDRCERLRRKLSELTNKRIEIVAEVDPEIVGGVVARIGTLVIDGSVRGRLERMALELIEEN